MRLLLLLAVLMSLPAAAAPGLFSRTGLEGWTPHTFGERPRTRYALVEDAGATVVRADCAASASGLIHKGTLDLRRTPILEWRWKVDSVFRDIDERRKSGDDFPARLYVVRDGGLAVWRTRSLVYVWASSAAAGTDFPNAYTGQAHIVVLQSGAAKAGQWQTERRDLRADLKRYFGLDAEQLDGIALMSDCDDAGGSTRAWFGDVRLQPAER
jgi:hypothetical protein